MKMDDRRLKNCRFQLLPFPRLELVDEYWGVTLKVAYYLPQIEAL